MEAYPAELTSPPVPLVALCGPKELLHPLGDYLRTQHVPRINAVGVEDAHSVASKFGVRKPASSSTAQPSGILKAGWLRKHRNECPAVVAVLVERDAVVGDPSAWAWLVSQLDAVKAGVKNRGARVVVLVVLPPGSADIPEDRMAMLCRQAGTERRCVLTYNPSEGLPALQVLGRVLQEQAAAFYSADAQRRLALHAHRNVSSLDLSLRAAFKLGALAEFRADWGAALRMYSEAYGYVPQLLAVPGATQLQRFAEIRAVAEQVHVKAVSLLLLVLKQPTEAVAQFEMHLRLFRRLPFQAPPGLLASHHAWLSRQYMVMAELLMSCGADLAALKRELQPGQLYLAAAKAAIERRKVAGFISGMHGGKAPAPPGRVEPGLYVGQLLLMPDAPAGAASAAVVAAASAAVAAALLGASPGGALAAVGAGRRMTNEQFELVLEAEECGTEHSRVTVDLLRTAQDVLKSSGQRANKTLQHAMLLLGHELVEGGETEAAERLLTEVAGLYRRERWEGPLASTLLLLRECRQHAHDLASHTQLSLEVSALGDGSLDGEQLAAMATAAVSVLVPEPPLMQLDDDAAADTAGSEKQAQHGVHFTVASPASGWLTVLPLCAGFFDPQRPAAPGSSPPSVRFATALWSNAPIDLPLASAEVHVQDALGSFTAPLLPAEQRGSTAALAAATAGAPDLVLPPAAWQRLSAAIPVRCSGELRATAVVLRFGDTGGGAGGSSSITFQLAELLPGGQQQPAPPASPRARAPATAVSGRQVPNGSVGWLRGGWAASQPPFSATAGFLPGQCCVEVPPQHAPPLLALQASEVLLQGEQAAVTITVVTAGDALEGAVLRGRALHVESQQQLGLVPAAGGPVQGQAEEGREQQGGSADGASLQLGDLGAEQRRQVVLLLDARYRGSVEVAIDLQYTVAARGGEPEAGHCSALLALHVELPWKLSLQLLAPPATHTLLSRPPPAAGQEPSAASSEGDADPLVLLEQQQRRLQMLSVQSGLAPTAASSAAVVGGELGPADGRDLSLLLLRGLPQRLVLPAGQRCTALVQLQSLAACQLDVLGVELEGADGVTVLAASAAADAAFAANSSSCISAGGAASPADTLNKSDVFTAAFSVASGSSVSAELPSLGVLRVRWRRHQRRPPVLATASRGGRRLGSADTKAAVEELGAVSGSDAPSAAAGAAAAAAAATTAPACEVLIPMPVAAFLPPLLSASVLFPPCVAAGQPASLQLLLHNTAPTAQEVAVAVGDPHGFLLAGPKSTVVQLLPHSNSSVTWQVVPYHLGHLHLPEITASAAQLGQHVEVTRGCAMLVVRPTEQQEAVQHDQQATASHNAGLL